jgi:hypothetical protein
MTGTNGTIRAATRGLRELSLWLLALRFAVPAQAAGYFLRPAGASAVEVSPGRSPAVTIRSVSQIPMPGGKPVAHQGQPSRPPTAAAACRQQPP